MINALRSVLAIVAGLLVITLVVEAIEFGLVTLVLREPTTDPSVYFGVRNRSWFLGLKLLYNCDGAVLGGFLAAQIAGRAAVWHGVEDQMTIRRVCLIAVFAVLPIAATIAQTVPEITYQYPSAIRTVIHDSIAGIQVNDPYRWLEDSRSQATRTWTAAESELTDRFFRQWPATSSVRERLRDLVPAEHIERFATAGRGYLATISNISTGERMWVGSLAGMETASALSFPDNPSHVSISPDGRRAISITGSKPGDLVLRRRHGAAIFQSEQTIPGVVDLSFAWSSTSDSFVYVRLAPEGSPAGRQVCINRIAERVSEECIRVSGAGAVEVKTVDAGPLVAVRLTPPDPPPATFVGYQQPVQRNPAWLGLIDFGTRPAQLHRMDLPKRAEYHVIGARAGLIRTLESESSGQRFVDFDRMGKVHGVTLPITVLDGRIDTAVEVSIGTVLETKRETHSRVVVLNRDGDVVRDLQLPTLGIVSDLRACPDGQCVIFRFSSFSQESSVFVGWTSNGRVQELAHPTRVYDPGQFVTTRLDYHSHDGTIVPMLVTYRRDRQPGVDTAALLYVYGGYGWIQRPVFHQRWFAWLDSGGVLAVAYVRGDGIRGQPWHDAARGAFRTRAVEDTVAAAQFLIDRGLASPKRLGLHGLSFGGGVAGAALLKAPQLFGAAVLEVPAADLIRGGFPESEIGPLDAQGTSRLLKISPYHMTEGSGCLPPTLIVTSDDDAGVGHARKFTAAVQAYQRCPAPVLMRVGSNEGHLPSGVRGSERHAAQVAFLRSTLTQ